jgi:Ca-activated chloride channel family protein
MAEGMRFDDEVITRLEGVKRVFAEFVRGNGEDLPGRPNDLIGLVTYGTYADTICPLTLAHGALNAFLEKIQIPRSRDEQATAIGDAIALAAARLKTAEEVAARQSETAPESYTIKSKVMILLTDGDQTAGKRTPQEAAALAKEWGIKIHVIGIGGQYFRSLRGRRAAYQMKKVAEETGGIFAVGDDAESLRTIYREIDALEVSELTSLRYMNYRERFVPFLAAALACLLLELVLSATVLRRVP